MSPSPRRAPAESESAEPSPSAALPLEGSVTVRVRYGECDPQGVAHHASYIPWLELARTELLRGTPEREPSTGRVVYSGGVSYAAMERAGVFLVVSKLGVSYKAPALYDEVIEVFARVTGGGRARIDHGYEVWRLKDDGSRLALLATAETTLACVGSDGKPRPLPAWLSPAGLLSVEDGGGAGAATGGGRRRSGVGG